VGRQKSDRGSLAQFAGFVSGCLIGQRLTLRLVRIAIYCCGQVT